MNALRTVLAMIGFAVVVMWLLGAIDMADFVLTFTPHHDQRPPCTHTAAPTAPPPDRPSACSGRTS